MPVFPMVRGQGPGVPNRSGLERPWRPSVVPGASVWRTDQFHLELSKPCPGRTAVHSSLSARGH